MDADTALALVNEELKANGHPEVFLTEPEKHRAFATLRTYALTSGRPIEKAVKDLVKFQLQTIELERLRRLS